MKLTKERRGKIQARLAEGATVEELKQAVDGCFATPWNVEGRFTDIELICRNAGKVDRYKGAGQAINGSLEATVSRASLNGNVQP